MAAVTQSIPNFLGGVSNQPDEKKAPGQVKDILNGYPDPTFGLTKRNGTQYLLTLESYDDTTDVLEGAHWFFINRTEAESYFGAITTTGDMRIWNAITREEAEIEYIDDAKAYLTVGQGQNDYDVTTVQDLSYVINKKTVVTEEDRVEYPLGTKATIILKVIENKQKYSVFIDGTEYTYNSPDFPDALSGEAATSAETILAGIKAALPASISTVQLASSLELSSDSPFTIDVKAGTSGLALETYQDEIDNASRLTATSVEGRRVKVVNTSDDRSSYFVRFVANEDSANPNGGTGYWEESLGWDLDEETDINYLASEGVTNATMPHSLINFEENKFKFAAINYERRLVGSRLSNPSPSFVDQVISQGFIHANRLGFLSRENVIFSQASEFNNFYYVSAQTVIESDPIDLNCSSIRPAELHAVIPQAQGIILFSRFEQFKLFSEDSQIKPSDAIIRSISNYETDPNIDPVDVGTNVIFLSKTPAYTRTMAMTNRGRDENPIITDIGKIASQFVPSSVDNLVASPQNSFVAMSSQDGNIIYFYRFFNNGQQDIMQAWFRWELPGKVQTLAIAQDMILTVIKGEGEYTLLGTSIAQSVTAGINGVILNPRMDVYFPVTETVTYDPVTRLSHIPKPYTHKVGYTPIVGLTPVIDTVRERRVLNDINLTVDATSSDMFGSKLLPVTVINGEWYVEEDWTGFEARLLGGYLYDFEVDFPTTYFRQQDQVDYTAQLTISRYKFSLGDTGLVNFKTKAYGTDEWTMVSSIPDANYYLADSSAYTSQIFMTVPIYQKNGYFDFKLTADTPLPVSLNSMMWEGIYSPRYYRRT